jgi:hypothetical protein
MPVGVIGTEDTVGGFTEFLAETARGIESENKQLINLNPDFPGLGNQNAFRCKFEVPDRATATLSRRQVTDIREIGRHDLAVRHAVELRPGGTRPGVPSPDHRLSEPTHRVSAAREGRTG